MTTTVRGKNLEVTAALREYVEKLANKLARYFDGEVDVQVLLSKKKETCQVEFTCFVEKIVLRGVEANSDMYAAIDLVFDKIVRQIHKHKTRLAKRIKGSQSFVNEFIEAKAPVEEEVIEVVRRKSFEVQPMSPEEAILQMNLVGHDFFMFFNADTETINVVYKRKNGKYGLIEPEF